MPAYEPNRPRPNPAPEDGEVQIDALLDPTPSSNVINHEGPPDAPEIPAGSAQTPETTGADLETTALGVPSIDVNRAGVDDTGSARADSDAARGPSPKRVQSLPPEPEGHGPGPLVPMAVTAVLLVLVILYLRSRRRRH